ncbi:MAG: hypothetical protein AB7K68_11700 [Bacteriovoracia bacterium]
MKRILLSILALPLLAVTGWFAYGAFLQSSMPRVEIREVSSAVIDTEKTLPFYELMSPLPSLKGVRALPKLEYKKGPPERFLERITVLFQPDTDSRRARDRIVYYGRKTETDSWAIRFFPESQAREALFLEAAIRQSQGQSPEGLSPLQLFLAKPALLHAAKRWLPGVAVVNVMRQADTPAFLFEYKQEASSKARATALFLRRNSLYRVEYLGEKGFALLDPISLFRKSFLVEKRTDALEYLARNLSEVKMGSQEMASLSFRDITWPILLLAANVSVDPASLDGYFHFAGISALLLRSKALDNGDVETIDILRNNVLSSEFYAKDIDANAQRTTEISRLARLLTRNF